MKTKDLYSKMKVPLVFVFLFGSAKIGHPAIDVFAMCSETRRHKLKRVSDRGSLHDNGGTCFMSGSAVPWNDVAAVSLIAVRTGSFIRPGRINERPSIDYALYRRCPRACCVCLPPDRPRPRHLPCRSTFDTPGARWWKP